MTRYYSGNGAYKELEYKPEGKVFLAVFGDKLISPDEYEKAQQDLSYDPKCESCELVYMVNSQGDIQYAWDAPWDSDNLDEIKNEMDRTWNINSELGWILGLVERSNIFNLMKDIELNGYQIQIINFETSNFQWDKKGPSIEDTVTFLLNGYQDMRFKAKIYNQRIVGGIELIDDGSLFEGTIDNLLDNIHIISYLLLDSEYSDLLNNDERATEETVTCNECEARITGSSIYFFNPRYRCECPRCKGTEHTLTRKLPV